MKEKAFLQENELLLFNVFKKLVYLYKTKKKIRFAQFSKFNLFFNLAIQKNIITYFCPRAPPRVNSKKFELMGGKKVEQRPKRTRDKENAYILHSEKEKNIYKVTFSNEKKTISVDITEEIFNEFDEFEKEDVRQIQEIARHNELNIVTEATLNRRVFNKPEWC